MGHDWIFDVLEDLKSYATENGLHGLATKADEALKVAIAEIGAADPEAVAMLGRKGLNSA